MAGLHEIVERVCIGQDIARFTSTRKFRCFTPQTKIVYYPYCDDFGPMSLLSITRFVDMLCSEPSDHPLCKIVYCVDHCERQLTNAIFLVGAYKILKLELAHEEVLSLFSLI